MVSLGQLVAFGMAFLTVMPVCLCGHWMASDSEPAESACCSCDTNPDENNECERQCHLYNHSKKLFISEARLSEENEDDSSLDLLINLMAERQLSPWLSLSWSQLQCALPPPDLAVSAVKRCQLYCSYRL